jgi:GTP-binding protein LepA
MSTIRNFVIIAHVDHGKSTLADRLLEATGTVEARRMKPQYLDQLELERERGITIKMAPVRMLWHPDRGHTRTDTRTDAEIQNGQRESASNRRQSAEVEPYVLNLIDTPGHSDFSYEVSRALAAVEGAVLLVDVTKGIQAQTLSVFRMARAAGLSMIGVVNKVDLLRAQTNADDTLTDADNLVDKRVKELASLLGCSPEDICKVSGKTGEGVEELLKKVVEKVPPPHRCESVSSPRLSALVFDSLYDDHKGIVAYVRVFEGEMRVGDEVTLLASGARVKVKEVGHFAPEFSSKEKLYAGDIGYLATGLKEPALVKIGDTVASAGRGTHALPGYREAAPVVFISFYPDGATKYEYLKKGLERLRLSDPALHVEPDSNEALGRGLKVGFLGQLHFEIASDRLRRESGLEFITSFPSIAYRVREPDGTDHIVTHSDVWPARAANVFQPMIKVEILAPSAYLNQIMSLKSTFEMEIMEMNNIGTDHVVIMAKMPLAQLIRDFDDQLKSASAGFASFSYERAGEEEGEVRKMEVLVANEVQPALTRVVSAKDVEREARNTVERLKELLPQQQFPQALQAVVEGRIVARETIPAMRKDVTGYLYGGDRSRKMKLWKKQQRGKERLKAAGRVHVPVEVFRQLLKK